MDKKGITQQDIDRIMQYAPDYIQEASDIIKDLYVAAELAKEERDTTPKRYHTFTVKGGDEEKTVEIDFQQQVNVSAVIYDAGGNITDVRSANAIRLQYLKYERTYQNAVLALNKELGTKSRRPKNIVDYTGVILEMFGKFYTVTDVTKVMAKEYRIKVPDNELKKFYVDNRDLITRRRAEYVLQNKDFRVATETGRLEVLNQMLTEVEIKNRAAGGTNMDYCNLILKIIEQARKEVKGNEIKMTVDGRIDINATLQAESNVMTVMKRLSINALVVGLTAAKAGLNPSVLIAQLANSWYSKFNGFNNNIMDGEAVQLPSALIKQYNWNQIEEGATKFVDEFVPITEIIEDEHTDTAEERRKVLLERLRQLKNEKVLEVSKANPVTPDDKNVKDLKLKEPAHEFEIDYNLNKHYKQKRGMRIKGAIKESVARHKAAKEENNSNLSEEEQKRLQRAKRRKERRDKRKDKD